MFYKKPSKEHILLYKGQASLPALPARFSLCVWNLHKGKDRGWREEFIRRCTQTDLFLAQEAVFCPGEEEVFLSYGLQWTAAISFLSWRQKAPTGVATGCRAAALQADYRAEVMEPLFKIPKMTLATVYPTAKGPLLVMNLHAINFKGFESFHANMDAAKQLLAGFPGAVLAAGDFNVWSKRRLDYMRQTAADMKLQEAPFKPDLRSRFWGHQVDFLFTRGLRILNVQAEPTRSSDHNPLTAQLELDVPPSKYAKI